MKSGLFQKVAANARAQDIPYVPSCVNLDSPDRKFKIQLHHQDSELLVLPKETITKLVAILQSEPDNQRYGKKLELSKYKLELGDASYGIVKYQGDLYAITDTLGRGAFGSVKAMQKLTGENRGHWYAFKIIYEAVEEEIPSGSPHEPTPPRPRRGSSADKMAEDERQILIAQHQSPKGPALQRRRSYSKPFDESYIIMSLAKGDTLANLLDTETELQVQENFIPAITPALRIELMLQMCKGVLNFFSTNTLHRDIKNENIVIDIIHQTVTWIDFGFAGKLNPETKTCVDTEIKSTSIYIAPELREPLRKKISDDNAIVEFVYSEKTEVYALGIVLAQLFDLFDYQSIPRSDKGKVDMFQLADHSYVAINKHDGLFTENQILAYTKENPTLKKILKLIHHMTEADPNQRYDLKHCIHTLEKIKNKQLARRDQMISVLTIDINEYVAADRQAREALIKRLQDRNTNSYHEVWFTDTTPNRNLAEYAIMINELQNPINQRDDISHISFGDKVFIAPTEQEAISALNQHLATRTIPANVATFRFPAPAAAKEYK